LESCRKTITAQKERIKELEDHIDIRIEITQEKNDQITKLEKQKRMESASHTAITSFEQCTILELQKRIRRIEQRYRERMIEKNKELGKLEFEVKRSLRENQILVHEPMDKVKEQIALLKQEIDRHLHTIECYKQNKETLYRRSQDRNETIQELKSQIEKLKIRIFDLENKGEQND